MRWLLLCFCLLAESYETINHYHYHLSGHFCLTSWKTRLVLLPSTAKIVSPALTHHQLSGLSITRSVQIVRCERTASCADVCIQRRIGLTAPATDTHTKRTALEASSVHTAITVNVLMHKPGFCVKPPLGIECSNLQFRNRTESLVWEKFKTRLSLPNLIEIRLSRICEIQIESKSIIKLEIRRIAIQFHVQPWVVVCKIGSASSDC